MLGPITLATILHNRGDDAAVYNENISGSLLENAKSLTDVCSADVVGISIMTSTASRGYTIADAIRRKSPDTRIVFGGVHATFVPGEAVEHGDIVVRGEGETVIEDIVDGNLSGGIIDAPRLENLDDVPTLDHSVVMDFQRLQEGLRRELYDLPVMTSRGCPHGCTYCSVTRMFGRKVRRQSPGKIAEDMKAYTSRGYRRFMFYDDNFTSNRDWAKEVLERFRPLKPTFKAQVRADFHWRDGRRTRLDRELLRLMREGGANMLFVGYETVEDSTAEEWHKGYRGAGSLESRLLEDTRILHESDFWVHGMFVVGPQHSADVPGHIVDFARRGAIESLQISVLTPFPGTPLFDEMRPHLIFNRFPGDWDFYDGTHCVYNHGSMPVEEVQRTIFNAHKRFYRNAFNLSRLRGILRESLPLKDRLSMLWRNARIARTTFREWRRETENFIRLVRRAKLLHLS